MAVIPIVLQFSGVAQNYNLCVTLTTPGVAWSMGPDGEDCLGISYNALFLGNQQPSCIRRIEFTGSTLTITTGPMAGKEFTITAFIDAPDDAEWLQGYCIYNENARLLVRLGDLAPTEWQRIINCAIPNVLPDIHRATLVIRGAREGQFIRIGVAGGDDSHHEVRWRVAPLNNQKIGLVIKSARDDVSVPMSLFMINSENIDLTVAASGTGRTSSADLILEAYIERISSCRYCPPPCNIRVRAEFDKSIEITAQIGCHQPQYLASEYKLFVL